MHYVLMYEGYFWFDFFLVPRTGYFWRWKFALLFLSYTDCEFLQMGGRNFFIFGNNLLPPANGGR